MHTLEQIVLGGFMRVLWILRCSIPLRKRVAGKYLPSPNKCQMSPTNTGDRLCTNISNIISFKLLIFFFLIVKGTHETKKRLLSTIKKREKEIQILRGLQCRCGIHNNPPWQPPVNKKPPWLNDQPSSGSLLLNQFTPGAKYAAQRQSSHGHWFSACKQSLERQKCSILGELEEREREREREREGGGGGERNEESEERKVREKKKKENEKKEPRPMTNHCAAAAPRCH